MALASFEGAKSVVGLSKSPVFHHQYSSLHKAVAELAKDERSLKRVKKIFQEPWLEYFRMGSINHFQTDVVNIFREHSKCLKDTQFVNKANNRIHGNKPVGIGYPLSSVNVADFESNWSVPFELTRVKSNENAIEVGARQIKEICKREEFAKSLNINAADSSYGTAKYIAKVFDIDNARKCNSITTRQ